MKRASAECKVLNDGEDDIAVTVDGTWMRRGHVSKFGATSVISVDNGKVLGTEVCSKFCHSCSRHFKDDKKSTEYKEWYVKHKSNCAVNFEGTSGGMEVAAALEIFSRSEERNSLRYVKYIGDGDSRSFKAIIEMKQYEDIEIIKLECIGHIQKRMGKRLRNFRIEMKGKNLVMARVFQEKVFLLISK
jgi:hypothetical protein